MTLLAVQNRTLTALVSVLSPERGDTATSVNHCLGTLVNLPCTSITKRPLRQLVTEVSESKQGYLMLTLVFRDRFLVTVSGHDTHYFIRIILELQTGGALSVQVGAVGC